MLKVFTSSHLFYYAKSRNYPHSGYQFPPSNLSTHFVQPPYNDLQGEFSTPELCAAYRGLSFFSMGFIFYELEI